MNTVGASALFFCDRSIKIEEFIVSPITTNYPSCYITTFEQTEPSPTGWETWISELELDPELFPILRHSQFEDMLNQNFADPISDILRAIRPYDQLQCCIEISSHRRNRNAVTKQFM